MEKPVGRADPSGMAAVTRKTSPTAGIAALDWSVTN